MKSTLFALLTIPFFSVAAADMKVTIQADFPGGNVVVQKNEGNTIQVAPDLRGGKPWFYWCFDAEASQPGRVTFVFAGPPKVGVRGPAISRDGGKSWQWLGAEHVVYAPPPVTGEKTERHDSFQYEFTAEKQRVRFAVAIPYLQRELDEFLAKNEGNPHLARSVLTRTRKDRPVDSLQVGKPGPGIGAVLLTARHHACESMASYVLEGFLREAMAESPAGMEFRKRYVLYAVPLVDKDGVEDGDQGKNRSPHDHNRDYGDAPIYTEVKAIQELAEQRDIHFSLDLHCPALRGDIHEAFHFMGLAVPHIQDNVNELTAWLKEERPPTVMVPLNLLKDPAKPNAVDRRINSHYFATREHAIFAATLEVPYTQPGVALDADMARAYGVSLLKAWVRTAFLVAGADASRGASGNAGLLAFRSEFLRLYRSKPEEAGQMAEAKLGAATSPVYRAEASSLMATLRLRQQRFTDALSFSDAVIKDANATTHQRATALLSRVQIIGSDPKSTADDVEACLTEALRLPYPSLEYQAAIFDTAGNFYQRKRDYERALNYMRKLLPVAAPYEKGKTLNRIAALHDLLDQAEQAVAARQEAVGILRRQLGPVPARSIFAAMMTGDLFDAISAIPTSTLEEKKEAAALVLNHEVTPAALKERVRKALAELEKK